MEEKQAQNNACISLGRRGWGEGYISTGGPSDRRPNCEIRTEARTRPKKKCQRHFLPAPAGATVAAVAQPRYSGVYGRPTEPLNSTRFCHGKKNPTQLPKWFVPKQVHANSKGVVETLTLTLLQLKNVPHTSSKYVVPQSLLCAALKGANY